MGWYDRHTRRVRDLSCGDARIYLELEVRRVNCRRCGQVKRERLEFLADNPFYTEALCLRYIKGQKYTLLSRRENLTLDGKRALKTLLAANKRLNTAYLLKESFGQLWSYKREGWARRFFRQLAGEPEVAALAAVSEVRRDDRAPLGWNRRLLQAREQSVTGLRRGFEQQDSCYPGLRDEEYLRLKVLTCMLPTL